MTNENLEAALDAWCKDQNVAEATYGAIETWYVNNNTVYSLPAT